ncbi:cell death-inducing p53-target protein 1 homolog [Plectropomus leopardus]|uniref:cell death-inducing p53-target protein 1 homolog n=1 Tax=Plectropomus leopardus TaxID=160734 RepID=UPI001C4C16D8|nr:cell death-inducing p53-target protein 1 homolog [Plectropomus leopardus]
MDPSKSATAPPQEWTDEKSSMAHAPPPPYQDQPYPGYPQPGYPPQPGFASPPQYGGPAYGQQPYPVGQQATVTVQPTVFVSQGPLANPVNDYLCYSIFTMLCCCLPLGIAALIYSISVSLIHLYLYSLWTAVQTHRTKCPPAQIQAGSEGALHRCDRDLPAVIHGSLKLCETKWRCWQHGTEVARDRQ